MLKLQLASFANEHERLRETEEEGWGKGGGGAQTVNILILLDAPSRKETRKLVFQFA